MQLIKEIKQFKYVSLVDENRIKFLERVMRKEDVIDDEPDNSYPPGMEHMYY